VTAPSVNPADDPAITEVTVMGGQLVTRGARVKHYAQRFTGCATATVTGFYNAGTEKHPWIMVLITGDDPNEYFSECGQIRGWDYDRTQVAPDI
jgi:hypothetical protein